MMVAKATKTCRHLIIYVKAYVMSVHLLVHYISVNTPLIHGYGIYEILFFLCRNFLADMSYFILL
jgi:hypothetical protein